MPQYASAHRVAQRAFRHYTTGGVLLTLVLLALSGCSEPFIVFSGKALSGTDTDPPEDWSALETIETMQLETRPDQPYSINLWAVGIGADLYIGTGPDGTRWSDHIDEDPRVRLRVGDNVYALVARPVTDTIERRRVAEGYVKKYDLDSDENWVQAALVYRLDRE